MNAHRNLVDHEGFVCKPYRASSRGSASYSWLVNRQTEIRFEHETSRPSHPISFYDLCDAGSLRSTRRTFGLARGERPAAGKQNVFPLPLVQLGSRRQRGDESGTFLGGKRGISLSRVEEIVWRHYESPRRRRRASSRTFSSVSPEPCASSCIECSVASTSGATSRRASRSASVCSEPSRGTNTYTSSQPMASATRRKDAKVIRSVASAFSKARTACALMSRRRPRSRRVRSSTSRNARSQPVEGRTTSGWHPAIEAFFSCWKRKALNLARIVKS